MSFKSTLISKSVERVLERDLPSILSIMNNIVSPRKIAKKIINDVNRELGFKPKIDLEEGLQHTIHWYKQNILKQN